MDMSFGDLISMMVQWSLLLMWIHVMEEHLMGSTTDMQLLLSGPILLDAGAKESVHPHSVLLLLTRVAVTMLDIADHGNDFELLTTNIYLLYSNC